MYSGTLLITDPWREWTDRQTDRLTDKILPLVDARGAFSYGLNFLQCHGVLQGKCQKWRSVPQQILDIAREYTGVEHFPDGQKYRNNELVELTNVNLDEQDLTQHGFCLCTCISKRMHQLPPVANSVYDLMKLTQ